MTAPHQVSSTVAQMRLSAIKEMAMLAARKRGAVSLAWGLPSFRTPEPVRVAVAAALSNDPDIGKYALPDGLPELREAVARHHEASAGIRADPDTEILISAGNMQAMHSLLRALLDPGDEVIVTDPGFTSHIQQIKLHGGTAVPWQLDADNGWRLDAALLPSLITPRTRAIIIVNPSNPTGTVFPPEDLAGLGAIAREHDLVICVDDPYSYFVYDDASRSTGLAADPLLRDHLAYLFTFSKIHAMSGWRLGYMVLPSWLRAEVLKVHDANMICTPRISQVAGVAALTGDQSHIAEFVRIIAARRQLICERLDRVPHVFDYVKPQGAYYVFPRIVAPHEDSWAFARQLLDVAGVSLTPGVAFGAQGEHHVRLAYCVDEDQINTAFDRIEAAFPG